PECFAKDLFLTDLVSRCITLRIKNRERTFHRAQLVRVLSQPPTELAEVQFRQAILTELDANAELRKSLEKAWLQIAEVTNRLETTERGKRYDPAARRIDILRDIKYALDLLDAGFSGATSGLSRVAVFGRSVRASKAYRDLSALLDHEDHLATVDLRVRLGQDGRLRGFEITEARENVNNPFHIAPLQRWLARVRMWLSGYRVRESELVGRIANHVFDQLQTTVVALLELGLHFEFYLAALALRDRAQAAGLVMCLPEFVDATQREPAHITGLFNPLLLLEGKTPVPCDLAPGPSSLVVITGPNSGGKTRLLEAIGLTQLLGQAGMFVPAKSARLCLRDGLFVSLLQETTADQPEG
ncbi:MAG TPA: DNA mismatch repair protein, partial [Polyangiales bacterium]|nr:DNA mismatch repair protein [Polyangiales bacterium]